MADHPLPGRAPLSPTVRALGLVSLFTDLSSEMVYPITPIFLTAILGAPVWSLGLVEGVAESTASILKLYSGWLSDRAGRRKPLTIAGYSLGAIAKPLLGISTAWLHVLAARFLDRIGKGLRTAPRDALIAENCSADQRGRAFGFHRSMDTVGAVLGPLIGYLLLTRLTPNVAGSREQSLRAIYFIAFVPGAISVLVLALTVRESRRVQDAAQRLHLPEWRSLSSEYRRFLLIVALFSIGNSSDAFLLLRARGMGVPAEQLLLLYAAFNMVEAALGYWAGSLSDRAGRKPLVIAGFAAFAVVYLGFGTLSGPVAAWLLFIAYGAYYTLTQGTQRAFAADMARPDRRAAEIGVYHLLVGIAALPASLLAGLLYSRVAASAPFILGTVTAVLSSILLAAALDKPKSPSVDSVQK